MSFTGLKHKIFAIAALAAIMLAAAAPAARADRLNDKVLNRPYSDMRRWHLGFSVGLNSFDYTFHHNGFVTDDGKTWFMEQPDLSPGFCVTGLFSLRFNDYFSLRVTPGMYFGNRVVQIGRASCRERV